MFTEKGRRSLDRIFEGLQEIKVPAYLTTRSGRKEVRDILNKLRDAREDEKKDLQAQLNYICSEYKVDIGLLAVSEERFLQSFPDKNDVINCLTEHFYELSKNAPSPGDYMSRLTDTMIRIRKFPEFKGSDLSEPTRLKILKRYIAGSLRDWKTYDLAYFYKIAEKKRADDKKTAAPLSPVSAAQLIDDSVFDLLKKMTPSQMITLIVRQAKNLADRAKNEPETNTEIFSDISVSRKVLEALLGFCSSYGVEADTGSVCAVLAALDEKLSQDKYAAADFDAHAQQLTEALEEQFRETLKKVRYTDKNNNLRPGGELWKYKKRDFLRSLSGDLPKEAKTALPLLEHCENTANGYFGKNSLINRAELYVYAIMFGMTCDLGIRDVREDETDISKNLFEDLYCDNMTRFMQSGAAAGAESEPDGASVNYKRYTDMIYIYYLMNHNNDELPGARVDKANSVIIECTKKAASDTGRASRSCISLLNDINATYRYRTEVAGDVVNCPEAKLADLICDRFSITDDDISRVDLNATALRDLNEVMQDIDEMDEENYMFSALGSFFESNGILDSRRYEAIESGADINAIEEKKWHREASAEKTRWLIQRQVFNRQFLDMLKSRYKDDRAFLKMIGKISMRVDEMSNTLLRNRLSEAALRALYFADNPLTADKVRSEMETCIGADISSDAANAAVDDLVRMGFDIERSAGTAGESDKTFFRLRSREYPDNSALREIMENMPQAYVPGGSPEDNTVTELLRSAARTNSRVTRSRLLAALANRYFYGETELPASLNRRWDEYDDMYYFEDLREPADVFDVFAVSADDILIEAGFQPLSPKNVYDMYLFFSILMYFICSDAEG